MLNIKVINDIAYRCACKASRKWKYSSSDDLYSVALIQGISVIKYIDQHQGDFETELQELSYASRSIWGAILNYAKEDYVIKIPAGSKGERIIPERYENDIADTYNPELLDFIIDLAELPLRKLDRAIIDEYMKGHSVAIVARGLNISRQTVYTAIKNLGDIYGKASTSC